MIKRKLRSFKKLGSIKPEFMKISRILRKTTKRTKPALKRKSKPTKAPSISKLIKEADRLFSLKVRDTGAYEDYEMEQFYNECFTCKNHYPIKRLHNGHYLSRYYKAARWDADNCRPQCMMCNLWKRGDPITFRQNLIKEIGEARVLAVEVKRGVSVKLTREYLTTLIAQLSL